MEKPTEKQLGMLTWLIAREGLEKHLKPHREEVGGRMVDYTKNTFIKWCEANMSKLEVSDLITILNQGNSLKLAKELLKEKGYEYQD